MIGDLETPLIRLTPSRAAYRKFVMAGLPIAGALVLIAVFRMAARWSDPVNRWGAAAVVVVAVLAAAIVADYLRHASVTVTPTSLIQVGYFRRRHVSARSDLGVCVLLQGLSTASFSGPMPNLFVLTRDGRRALRLYGAYYPEPQLIALARATALPIDGRAGVTSPKALRAQYPGTATWVEAHPIALAMMSVGVALVVIIAVAAVVVASGGGRRLVRLRPADDATDNERG